MTAFAQELEVAGGIARRAAETALRYWRTGLEADAKSDDSPVTVADRECEKLIASALDEAFPDDGLLGEEGAAKPSRNRRRWIIDPIDGTRDFVRGYPTWAVLLALEQEEEVVAGFACFPAFGELISAARGAGALVNGSPIRASNASDVSRAVLTIDALNEVGKYPWAARLLQFMAPFWAVRSMGGCYDAMMVARGVADLWIETGGKPWDFAPLKIIAEEAGARFFDFSGQSTIYGGNCVICSPGLEEMARRFVGQVAP
jgi:histidinol phosphatase-like enzyme (inositol monophosphatase family)